MAREILQKAVKMIFGIVIMSLFLFFLFYSLSGNRASFILSDDATEKAENEYKAVYDEEKSFIEGYFSAMKLFFSFSWGENNKGEDIKNMVFSSLSITFSLVSSSILISLCFSLFVSIKASTPGSTFWAFFSALFSALFVVLPSFLVAIILVSFFSVNLSLFPPSGYVSIKEGIMDHFMSLVLPTITLSLISSSYMLRFFREALDENMKKGYVQYALSKGVKEKEIVTRSAFKPSLPVVISVTAECASASFASSAVCETVFALPGFGRLLVESALERNRTLSFLLVMVLSIVISLILFVSNVLCSIVDRRGERENGKM